MEQKLMHNKIEKNKNCLMVEKIAVQFRPFCWQCIMEAMNDDSGALRDFVGVAPRTVLFCLRCNKCTTSCVQDSLTEWSIKLICGSCSHSWHICRLCSDQRTQLDTKRKIHSHSSRCHQRKKQKTETPDARSSKTPPVQQSNSVATVTGTDSLMDEDTGHCLDCMMQEASQDHCITAACTDGNKWLVAKVPSMTQRSYSQEE